MFSDSYPDSEDEPFWKALFRTGIYTLFPTMVILFMHYKKIDQTFENKYENKLVNGAVENTIKSDIDIIQPEVSGAFEPVKTLSIIPDL